MVVFGLNDKYLICETNEKYGSFLLNEVVQTGNMGHSDKRIDRRKLQSAFGRYMINIKRDFRIMHICPSEALWDPFANIYFNIWRLKYKII